MPLETVSSLDFFLKDQFKDQLESSNRYEIDL